jgi:hypothetical protein
MVNLLSHLATDPSAKEAYANNPDALLDKHGFSDEHKARFKAAAADMAAGNTDSMKQLVGDSMVHPDTCLLITIP